MKSILQILLFSGFVLSATAQNFKPQKVTKEELLEKIHPLDTSAPAAILHKVGKTFFLLDGDSNWNVVTEVTMRIKIYKKDGYRYATNVLPYYTGGKTIKAFFTDAYTYNISNNEIVRTRLKSDGEFKEKISDDFERKKITMPDVKEGSIIEFTYNITSPYINVFRDWYFQHDIPSNYVEYKVSIPQYLSYNKYLGGYISVDKAPTVYVDVPGKSYRDAVDVYHVKNVKALKDEMYVNNIENYMAILKHELASTNYGTTTKTYSTDWAAVSKMIYEHNDFGKELNYESYFQDDLKNVLSGAMGQADRMERIFNYVKNRMSWNEGNHYLCEKGVKKAYETKTGNTAEINLMLTAMLRSAGFSANPVLVSTRDNGVALYPAYSAYNYVIAGVETENGMVLLDATSKYTSPDILPFRSLNWFGRMIKKDGSTVEVDLMPRKNSKEIMSVSAIMDKEGNITGKLRNQYSDYYAYGFKESYASISDDACAEKLEKKYQGLEIGAYKRTMDKEAVKPVMQEYDFTHKNVSDVIGDKIYFNPMLFLASTENPFNQEVREYPVDFGYPWQDKYMINITIPEGYVVETLPKPISVAMEENIGSFKYNLVSQKNTIQLSISFDMNHANISHSYYKTLKDFYKVMIDKQTEKVVLKKV